MKNLFNYMLCGALSALCYSAAAQPFTEPFGSVASTSTIAQASPFFVNTGFTYVGNADVRNTSPSTAYPGASGNANIFFTNTPPGTFFEMSGINTLALGSPMLSFGLFKSTTTSNAVNFMALVSVDGINYSPLSFPPLPIGTGTSHWYLVNVAGFVPAASNLRIRFINNDPSTQYRVDDVKLTATTPSCTASITANGPTTFCKGDSVKLTANAGASYLWSNGATTQAIYVKLSGTYNVTVTAGNGCKAAATPVVVNVKTVALNITNSRPVITLCYGKQHAKLTANASGGSKPYNYTWSSAQTTSAIVVCPVITTTYIVMVTDSNGCSKSDTTVVKVINACCEGTNVIVCVDSKTICVEPDSVAAYVAEGGTVGPCGSGDTAVAARIMNKPSTAYKPGIKAYPNPFNESAVFEVSMRQAGAIKIEVMDVSGKKVAELNSNATAAGTYKLSWNGSGANGALAGGLYLCRITAGGTVQTVKLQKLSDR